VKPGLSKLHPTDLCYKTSTLLQVSIVDDVAYRTASLEVYPCACRAAYCASDRKVDQCVDHVLWILEIDFENVTGG